ncbi:MAG TPA: TolC family protein [Flavihumibacter sp.]|nr:TolC family protein [Bacteroidota bacterium]HOA36874.1 TolC family protein [Flavihumibacter sp.]HPZ86969.1 TolC family protein [Flavihumibacter sp.]HQD09348.1 TolC family protein [Flavihumibacter sp.]
MRSLIATAAILFACLCGVAQPAPPPIDTLHLSVPEAEKLFLQRNLDLLAAKYNVDANKALIQQAKLWDNPVLNTDQNIYDGKFFRHNNTYGQVFVQVQQLIRTAGKRSKLAQLATDNTAIAQAQFDDVVRSLHYTLLSDMIEVGHLGKIISLYSKQIVEVDKLVTGMEQVYQLGNISLKDNLRLKALLFGLQNDLLNVQSQVIPLQAELRLLLQTGDSTYIVPDLQYGIDAMLSQQLPPVDSLVQAALSNRPDLKIATLNRDLQAHNIIYQKALAKPDLTIGPEYDQRSSYINHYVGLSVSLPLPLFNRNQGNIKSAEASFKQTDTQVKQQNSQVSGEVRSAIEQFLVLQKVNSKELSDFAEKYDGLFQNMLKSYQARQINLLDFTDFLDAYKETRLKLTEQQMNFVKAAANLDFVTNQPIVPLQ